MTWRTRWRNLPDLREALRRRAAASWLSHHLDRTQFTRSTSPSASEPGSLSLPLVARLLETLPLNVTIWNYPPLPGSEGPFRRSALMVAGTRAAVPGPTLHPSARSWRAAPPGGACFLWPISADKPAPLLPELLRQAPFQGSLLFLEVALLRVCRSFPGAPASLPDLITTTTRAGRRAPCGRSCTGGCM